MIELSLTVLWIVLIILLLVSAFFSGSETSMMAVDRYRILHLMRSQHRAAKRVHRLLMRPDRLLGAILIGNTFANIFAASVATLIADRLFGDVGIVFATIILTLTVLVFCEVTPKTLAAMHPERFAFIVSWLLKLILRVLYPLVWIINAVSNGLLICFGFRRDASQTQQLTQEELRTIVNESTAQLSKRHKTMLLRILDLRDVTVDHIMVPRNEIIAIDLQEDWHVTMNLLNSTQHTRLPVFEASLDELRGVIHAREILRLLTADTLDKDHLCEAVVEPDYVLEGTSLTVQLLNFQRNKRRIAFVVDEYGDIQGLVTLEDILEEIVGEFTTDMAASSKDVFPQRDGSYLLDGSVTLRELNRTMGWQLPSDGPRTLSGLITEYLEVIPATGTCCRIGGYPIEVIQVKDNMVKTARIFPQLKRQEAQ